MFGDGVDTDAISVRSATIGEETLVAAAPSRKVRETIDILASCGLRVVTIDHEACAFARAAQLPLLDVGLERSTLIVLANGLPLVRPFALGGAFFSDALAHEFGTSLQVAEIRKRTIGLGGAAAHALDEYVRALGSELDATDARAAEILFMCGNGARLASLREKIAGTFGIRVVPVDLRGLIEADLPAEVGHAGGFDWFGALALALPGRVASAA